MSWNIVDDRNLFLKLKSKLGLYHVVRTTPKTSPKKLTLTVVEMQQVPDIEKTDSKQKISCLKRTIYNGRRNVCVNFQTDTDKLNIIVYRYRNNSYLKDNEVSLNFSEYVSLLAKWVYLLSYIKYILQAVHCTGWNNCSYLKQTPSRMDVLFLMRTFRM